MQTLLTEYSWRVFTAAMPHFRTTGRLAPGDGAWLLYGGRLLANVPASFTATPKADDPDRLDFVVVIELDVVDGRLACKSLTAQRLEDGPPISSEGLHRIPVADYVRRAAASEARILRERIPQPDGSHIETRFVPPPPDFAKGGMTDEALEQAARVYAWAQATGQKATGILLNDYGLPRPTATRWIQTARRRGILRDEHQRMGPNANFGTQPTSDDEAPNGQR